MFEEKRKSFTHVEDVKCLRSDFYRSLRELCVSYLLNILPGYVMSSTVMHPARVQNQIYTTGSFKS